MFDKIISYKDFKKKILLCHSLYHEEYKESILIIPGYYLDCCHPECFIDITENPVEGGLTYCENPLKYSNGAHKFQSFKVLFNTLIKDNFLEAFLFGLDKLLIEGI